MTGLSIDQLSRLRESTFAAFVKLIDYALATNPDFVLIVGDIYDGEDRSLRAQLKFQEGMEKLNVAGIPVFISYGNHDHLSGRWNRFKLPSNVHVFDGEVGEANLNVNGQDISIYGFSYKERHIREAMIEHYPASKNEDAIHIGMLHGSLAGDESHAVYAPFTKSKLLEKHYDYWALGHIHLRQHLHSEPPIVYPGNLQGRHRNESGVKGFYEVELSQESTSFEFIPSSTIVFERLNVSCAGIRHANEWLEVCREVLNSFKREFGAGIVELTMTDVDAGAADLFSQSTDEEWLDVLQEFVDDREAFVLVQKIYIESLAEQKMLTGMLGQSVLGMMDGWTADEWKEIVKDLYQHTRGIRYLEVLTTEEAAAIKADAEKNIDARNIRNGMR